jgi:hypothetical protein
LVTLAALIAITLLSVRAAEGGVIITVMQVGDNVVAAAAGTIDLADLRSDGFGGGIPSIVPIPAFLSTETECGAK